MIVITILLILGLIFSIGFGVLSRMCGGGFVEKDYGLSQWVWGIPYGLVAFLVLFTVAGVTNTWMLTIPSLLAFLGGVFGKRLGHGQYMDLARFVGIETENTVESIDPLVEAMWGPDPNTIQEGTGNFWRDFTGLVIVGLLPSLISGIVVTVFSPLFGLGILLGGMFKALAYVIGYSFNGVSFKTFNNEILDEPTEFGEFLTGIFAGFPLGIALFYFLGLTLGIL